MLQVGKPSTVEVLVLYYEGKGEHYLGNSTILQVGKPRTV